MVFIFGLINTENRFSVVLPFIESVLSNVVLVYGVVVLCIGCSCNFEGSGVYSYPVTHVVLYLAISHLCCGVAYLGTTHLFRPDKLFIFSQTTTSGGGGNYNSGDDRFERAE